MNDLVISRISHDQTWPLRQLVLRPGRPIEDCRWADDELPATYHAGTMQAENLVAIGSLYDRGCDEAPGPNSWQLRGMAVDPALRRRGLGEGILEFLIDRCADEMGGLLVWCNARVAVTPFYQGHHFHVVGDEFDIKGIGPHLRMIRSLGSTPTTR